MALIVQKFGGTSVGSVERIRNVARRVAKWKAAGHDLVVVPSAMAGETDRLIALARQIQALPDPRALAAALKADECHIYTDVDGVYTADPRLVPEARRLRHVTFEEMIEMAGAGSKVLQIRAVEFAGKYRVPTRVLSSLTNPALPVEEEAQSGTLITFEEDPHMAMEKAVISGVAFNRDEAKITVHDVPGGHQHPDDLDLGDQDHRGDRGEVHRARRARAAQGL